MYLIQATGSEHRSSN